MNHVDMAQFIAPKSDQLNADDLLAGGRTIKITRVSANQGSAEQPISINYEGDNGKPYKPCKTMRRVMVAAWGRDTSVYPGRSLRLFRDGDVTFGDMKVGGIRISHMSDINGKQTLAVTATRGRKKPYTVEPLRAEGEQQRQPRPQQQQGGQGQVDRYAQGTLQILNRINAAKTAEEYQAVIFDDQVETQRKWLAENRADLWQQIETAIDASPFAQGGAATSEAGKDDPFGLPPVNDGTTDFPFGANAE